MKRGISMSLTYTLFGQKMEFAESAIRFYFVQQGAWDMAETVKNGFENYYKSCGGIEKVLREYSEVVNTLLSDCVVNELYKLLASDNIFDISKEKFKAECLDCSSSDEAFNIITDQYNQIIENQENAEAYRIARKESRARVSGGGFGVGGAVKGMAMAGAMNAVSGIGHSVVNTAGNLMSSISASSAKKKLYEDPSTLKVLRNGIGNATIQIFNHYITFMNKYMHKIKKTSDDYIKNVFDHDRSMAFFENAKNYPDKEKELLVEAIRNAPWDDEIYTYIFNRFPEEQKNIWIISEDFNIDLSECLEKKLSEFYTDEVKESEEKMEEAKKNILLVMKEFGVKESDTLDELDADYLMKKCCTYSRNSNPKNPEILEIIRQYDTDDDIKRYVIGDLAIWELANEYEVEISDEKLKARLYNEYTSVDKETEEKRLAARDQILLIMRSLGINESEALNDLERDCLNDVINGYEALDKNQCVDIRNQILNYNALEKNKENYIEKIDQRISQIEKELLENICIDIENLNEDECRHISQRIQDTDCSQQNKDIYQRIVEKRIYNIWDMEDFQSFSILYQQTPVGNQVMIQQNISLILDKGRTESKNDFCEALSKLNENDVLNAAKYAIAIENGKLMTFMNMNKKDSYQILTLNGRVMHPAVKIAIEDICQKRAGGIFSGWGNKKKEKTNINSSNIMQTNAGSLKYCHQCGKKIDSDANFCVYCGSKQ